MAVVEVDASGVVLTSGGAVREVVHDYFGNVDGFLTDDDGDGTGELSWRGIRYQGYGAVEGTALPHLDTSLHLADTLGWQARRIEPMGLHWIGFRYYDPTTSRFISPDPLGRGATPDLYNYTNGAPVNFVDPEASVLGTDLGVLERFYWDFADRLVAATSLERCAAIAKP